MPQFRHSTALSHQLKARIQDHGPLTFRDFMASALYDPEHGFYTKGPSIGHTNGEFNTNAMFPAFAFSLALAVQQAEDFVGEPIRILEFGGGTGELAENITSFLSSNLDYIIIEASPSLRKQQEHRGFKTVETTKTLSPAPTFAFGNEVLDAFAVHRVMSDGSGKLLEIYVDLDENGEFIDKPEEPSTPLLAKRLQDEDICLGRGQVADICLDFNEFLHNIEKVVSKGYVVFIDYGDEAANLYSYTRRNGSLRSFRSQKQTFDYFDYVGEQDLTVDVDFTALSNAAQSAGFIHTGSIRQGTWLKNLGIEKYREQIRDIQKAQDEIEQLTNMAQLGSSFDIQIFKTKGLPDGPGLHL